MSLSSTSSGADVQGSSEVAMLFHSKHLLAVVGFFFSFYKKFL